MTKNYKPALRVGLTIFSFFIFLFLLSGNIFAKVENAGKPVKLSGTISVTPKTKAQNCTQMQNQVTERVRVFRENRNNHFRNYQEAHDMMVKLFEKLDAKGYNTTAVRAKLNEMDTKIEDLKVEVDQAIAHLADLSTVDCQDRKVLLKQINLVHEEIKSVYRSEQEIVKIYRTEVKTAIKALRQQKVLTPKPTKGV